MAQRLRKKTLRSSTHIILMSILSFTIGFFMSYDAATMREKMINDDSADDTMMKNSIESPYWYDFKNFDAPSTTLELLGVISMKQKRLWSKLLFKDYGRFTSDVFNIATIEKILQVTPLSKRRLVRRIMIKILMGRMRCDNDECPPTNFEGDTENNDAEVPDNVPIFRWASVGDSSAAGHGNAYSQSYTAMLEKTAKEAFASAGIQFVATNHAGDVWSGMELAFCMDSITGRDVDVLSWDFSLSDPEEFSNPLSTGQGMDPALFGERAGRVFEALPFLFFLRTLSDMGSQERIQKLESRGMGTGLLNEDALTDLILTFPDQNKPWVPKAPTAVDKFNCGGLIEGKQRCDDSTTLYWCDPEDGAVCAKARYDAGKSCSNDQYQTSWNDGRKMHLLKGRLLGYYLVEMLRLAIVELDSLEQTDVFLRDVPSEAVRMLRAEEEVEEFLFSKTQTSIQEDMAQTSTYDWLKQKSSICATSLALSKKHETMRDIEFYPGEEFLCSAFLPHQNAFVSVHHDDEYVRVDPWRYSKILGDERQITRTSPGGNGVVLAICMTKCYGNQCGPHDPERNGLGLPIAWEKVEIRVDGALVTDLKPLGGCYFLKNHNSLLWDDEVVGKSSNGIHVRVHEGGEPIFITSSFVLY